MAAPQTSTPPSPVVAVLPVGTALPLAARVIAAHINGYLDLAADVLTPVDLPAHALDAQRLQYDAGILIQTLADAPGDAGHFKTIALLDVDLFIPLFTHVYGEARQNGAIALVSLYRLEAHADGSSPTSERVLTRCAKIALHELGHLLNLLHCSDPRCLMHFSDSLAVLDQIPMGFCRYCRRSLNHALGRGMH
jgi:archaemetzincin